MGEEEYEPDELGDPYSVMEERGYEAATLLEGYQREAAALFGETREFGEEVTPRVAWHLPHLTLCLEVRQADKQFPTEVRLTLQPPGQWPDGWS